MKPCQNCEIIMLIFLRSCESLTQHLQVSPCNRRVLFLPSVERRNQPIATRPGKFRSGTIHEMPPSVPEIPQRFSSSAKPQGVSAATKLMFELGRKVTDAHLNRAQEAEQVPGCPRSPKGKNPCQTELLLFSTALLFSGAHETRAWTVLLGPSCRACVPVHVLWAAARELETRVCSQKDSLARGAAVPNPRLPGCCGGAEWENPPGRAGQDPPAAKAAAPSPGHSLNPGLQEQDKEYPCTLFPVARGSIPVGASVSPAGWRPEESRGTGLPCPLEPWGSADPAHP
ncbi:uncharacterized protein LOC126652302 [Myiozetetes cayanensis]|uniref:uncharacterized protein LOC126652302 n=1 Tax=Myiozetetes cayanensis TaxID=478635 RepID=UPI002160BC85|nr:uncharacterized protein LOC126652302 [Myiozetetes cayanensis]